MYDVQLTHNVVYRCPGADPRTGMFYQTWPTAGETACSVKGVLKDIKMFSVLAGI